MTKGNCYILLWLSLKLKAGNFSYISLTTLELLWKFLWQVCQINLHHLSFVYKIYYAYSFSQEATYMWREIVVVIDDNNKVKTTHCAKQSVSFLLQSQLHFCYMKQSILCYSIWIVVQVIRELWSREGFLTSWWGYPTCRLSSNLTLDSESNLGILPLRGWWDNMMKYMQKSECVEKKIEIYYRRSSLFYVIMSIKFLSFLNCNVKRVWSFLNCSVKRVCWRLTLTISL